MTVDEPSRQSGRPRVLVGVDGSQDGLRAVRYATREAEVSGADLWIVNAVDETIAITGLWDVVLSRDVLVRAGEAIIAEAVAVARELGLPRERIRAEVLSGRPGDVLAELSSRSRLLVVGRRSLNGLERMFVGSTSVAVAVHAGCPVIVISAASTPHRTGDLKTVAVAVSTWPVHESAIEWGMAEAAVRHARLLVVHVVPETLGVEGARFVSAAKDGIEEQLAQLRAKHPDVVMEVDVRLGDPLAALVDATRTADILILGTHSHRAGLGGALRGVIAHAHCPVGLIK